MSSNHKLHPIYVALDGHQYSRAIKLASALPQSNILGQALLAVALQKSGQRFKCLQVLQSVLGTSCFELQKAIQSCPEYLEEARKKQQQQAPATTKARGKKSKKKAPVKASTAAAAVAAAAEITPVVTEVDWIEQLEVSPTVPENWQDSSSVAKGGPAVITDETTLSTLALPLQAYRMYVTVYQMYSRAAAVAKGDEQIYALGKSFATGLRLLCDVALSETNKLQLLGSMQVSALQLARLEKHKSTLYTKWAAQTALWQMEIFENNNVQKDEKLKQRQAMLPRLAESMAAKVVQQQQPKECRAAEDCLLYLSTLEKQGKKQEMLDFLETLLNSDSLSNQQDTDHSSIPLSTRQVQEMQAHVLMDLHLYEKAADLYQTMIFEHKDQWSYWMGCVAAWNGVGGLETLLPKMEELMEQVVESIQNKQQYLPRGPCLIKVELAAVRIRGVPKQDESTDATKRQKAPPPLDAATTDEDTKRLQEAIVEYASYWAPRASCAFSDLTPYVEILFQCNSVAASVQDLLEWAQSVQKDSSVMAMANNKDNGNNKEQRSRLRQYIFAVKMIYKMVELSGGQHDTLPDWVDLVKEWQATTSWKDSAAASKDSEVQKENQPGDELMLVAAKRLLHENNNNDKQLALYRAAAVLEMALSHSPYNSHLRIAAMDLYQKLHAVSRSFQLYQQLSIKHVQLDSCSYLVLNMLIEGGLYQDALEESNAILKLHATTFKDTGDFMGRAMERGTLSKANEFMVWQVGRMNTSLALLEAKGCIMDCAPLVNMSQQHTTSKKKKDPQRSRPLAVQYGIIGGDQDMERATSMAREAHNHFGAPNIVSLVSTDPANYSDNRDLTILSHQMMQPISTRSKEQLVSQAKLSGHVHGLLIRAALCVDATKGPKKGKVQKPSPELIKRCDSLLAAVEAASSFIESNVDGLASPAYPDLLHSMLLLCKVLVVVSSGMSLDSEDSLSEREKGVTQLLPTATAKVESATTKLSLSSSVAQVCRLLPDCLVAVFALLEMNSNLFATFGWGKRKRRTKSGAAALADFALALRVLVQQQKDVMSSLPANEKEEEMKKFIDIDDLLAKDVEESILDAGSVQEMAYHVAAGQCVTTDGVVPYLQYMIDTMDTFDVSDTTNS